MPGRPWNGMPLRDLRQLLWSQIGLGFVIKISTSWREYDVAFVRPFAHHAANTQQIAP